MSHGVIRTLINSHEALIRLLSAQGDLSLEDKRAIMAIRMTRRSFAIGQLIGREGRPVSNCMILTRGFAAREKTSGEGSRQIVSIHGPGDVLNIQAAFLPIPDCDIRTLEDCEVSLVDAEAIKALATERPAVAHSLLIGAFTDASIAREWILNVGQRDARTRLAHFLCEYLNRISFLGHPADGVYEIRLSQEQIGDATGITAVHVNRMLKSLQAGNLIEQSGRSIRVLDMNALENAGDYNRRYLQLPQVAS